ncbi:MAG TPA: guanylate kinase [Galbitalea sp.]
MSPRPDPPEVDRVAASRAAVVARRARAAVKHAVATRTRTARDVLDVAWKDPDSAEAGLRVRELLTSVPTLGPTRAAKVMADLRIADSKRAGGLGVRQRGELWNYLQNREAGRQSGHLAVLSGPTAVGKGTVVQQIREQFPEVELSVSATTRAPRPGEVDGVHYYFVSDEEFDRMIAENELLEWATVHNSYRYGTPRPPVDAAVAAGKRVLLEIDLQGARSVREQAPDSVFIFLLPPTWEELVRRLTGRGTEGPEEQAQRLDTARVELAAQDEFDYRVVNVDVGTAAKEVVDLMNVSGHRPRGT